MHGQIHLYFLFVYSFCVVRCEGSTSSSSPPPIQDNSWDYLIYSTRWAGTAGYGQTLPHNVTTFTLHGIWPQRNNGSYPSFCDVQDIFESQQIQDLIPLLEEDWYDYDDLPDYSFWSHEWDKHGTCAKSLPSLGSQHLYFSGAINLHLRYNITNSLVSAGIIPSDTVTYDIDRIAEVIQSAFGFAPVITCEYLDSFGGDALEIVELCIDTNLKVEDCPSNTTSKRQISCNPQVYFPTLQKQVANDPNTNDAFQQLQILPLVVACFWALTYWVIDIIN